MKFNEANKNIINFEVKTFSAIYFLLFHNEVVYVGQTTQGIIRPLSHKDKVYDSIKILPTDESSLDYAEDFFISKYVPKYNKSRNWKVFFTINRVKKKLSEDLGIKVTLRDTRKWINNFNIRIERDLCYDIDGITEKEYNQLIAKIKTVEKED